MSTSANQPRLIIHGGAGNVTRENLPRESYLEYSAALQRIHRSTSELLSKGATALDAATHAVTLFEDCPFFNCGKGAVFTRDGTIELEASVMVTRGYRKRACGIVLVKRVRNPIKLAREMLVRGESGGAGGAQGHSCLGGETVERLAKEWGLDMVEESYFWTKRRWDEHKRGLQKSRAQCGDEEEGRREEYLPQGTVGCVAMDQYGVMAVATSTGGLTNKLPSRIGDTPTIGAGFWAEEWQPPAPESIVGQQPCFQPSQYPNGLGHITDRLRGILGDCLPKLSGYQAFPSLEQHDLKGTEVAHRVRAVAMSGTGNGDSFLRLAAARTAGAIVRFCPNRSLASAVHQIAGAGGELQRSAGDRWGKTGEGEGGIIGIELVDGKGKVVFDFNCGGMFRCWVDEQGRERVMVFKDEY